MIHSLQLSRLKNMDCSHKTKPASAIHSTGLGQWKINTLYIINILYYIILYARPDNLTPLKTNA